MNGWKSRAFPVLSTYGNPFDTQSKKLSCRESNASEVYSLVGTATYATRMSGGVGERVKIPFLPDSLSRFLTTVVTNCISVEGFYHVSIPKIKIELPEKVVQAPFCQFFSKLMQTYDTVIRYKPLQDAFDLSNNEAKKNFAELFIKVQNGQTYMYHTLAGMRELGHNAF